ncbi:SDR family NAD(P)-dependent oxidoreductase [Nocardioides immobilis]|uniref:SDR family NAD(P)-dependent oxidoreductase n=2 Tax=Nocardioides immobilis TaxID=2049295 RepID=A0A417Y636_9ACTN|nr:SDR family NAD(P)-dependent oxidoreductase [Nocardioides immobilis]
MTGSDVRDVALVTGASSGIGVEIARLLASRGHNLVLAARRTELMEDLAQRLRNSHGVDVLVLACDLSLPGAARSLHKQVVDSGRQVTLLVNNAGATLEGRYLDFATAEQTGSVNLLAVNPAELIHCCLPAMLERGDGRVLTISSLGAYWPCLPGITVYAGSKALVVNLTRTLDAEYRGSGVRFSATVPFTTDTAFIDTPTNREIVGRMPRFMIQTPADVARIAIDGVDAGRIVQHTSVVNRLLAGILKTLPPALVARAIIAFMSLGRDDIKASRS